MAVSTSESRRLVPLGRSKWQSDDGYYFYYSEKTWIPYQECSRKVSRVLFEYMQSRFQSLVSFLSFTDQAWQLVACVRGVAWRGVRGQQVPRYRRTVGGFESPGG